MVKALRPKYVPYIIIGIVLIYLSIYGLEGFGLAVNPGFSDNFDDGITSSNWKIVRLNAQGIYPTVSETGGRLTISLPTSSVLVVGSYYTSDSRTWTDGSSVQVTMIIGSGTPAFNLGLTATGASGDYFIGPSGSQQYSVATNPSALEIYRQTGPSTVVKIYETSSVTMPVTVKITFSSGQIAFSLNNNQVYSEAYALSTRDLYVRLDSHIVSGSAAAGCYDNYVESGGTSPPTYSDVTVSVTGQGTTVPAAGHYATTYLVGGSLTMTATPASGWSFDYMTRNGVTASSMTLNSLAASEQVVVYFKQGPATTGTLRVFASYNGAYVVASITASGPQTVSGSTTTSSANPLAFTVTAGTYTVSGTYASGSASPVTVTVPAGGSVDANLNFGGSPPTSDFLTVIITAIKNFFNLSAVKTIFLLAGVSLTIGGSIMFLLKEKGERSRSPPAYPYY